MSNITMKPADIMIFEAGDDWVGKCIAWLTRSTVSHAALYEGDGKLIEMNASGIKESTFNEATDGSKVYIRRLNPEKDSAPVIAAARKYLEADIRYDFPALVILAGLLVYRTIRPTQKLQKITDLVINAACVVLDKLLQKATHSEGAMVCSELVYQCYSDCGEDYMIHLTQDGSSNRLTAEPGVSLAALLETRGDTVAASDELAVSASASVSATPEELAEELYTALTEAPDDSDELKMAVSGSLLDSVKKFLELVEKILEKAGNVIPVQSLFVTPGDLLNHAENLSDEGTVNIKRS